MITVKLRNGVRSIKKIIDGNIVPISFVQADIDTIVSDFLAKHPNNRTYTIQSERSIDFIIEHPNITATNAVDLNIYITNNTRFFKPEIGTIQYLESLNNVFN